MYTHTQIHMLPTCVGYLTITPQYLSKGAGN